MNRPRKAALLAALIAALAAGASAEVAQQGTLRVKLTPKLEPRRLPRSGAAPVAVSIAARLATTDQSVPPQLKALRIELNRHGRLQTAGLPECHLAQIQPATTAQALAACRAALVGSGSLSLEALLGGQEPYPTHGRLLLFNGKFRGHPALLGQIYAAHPFANSFVIPFRLARIRHGSFGTALAATLPPAFTSWAHITALRLRLARRYRYRGAQRSFLSAGCPAPPGISQVTFPLARVSFAFLGAHRLARTLTSSCRAHGS